MNNSQIENSLTPEDKMMVAVMHGVSWRYINMLLAGDRTGNTDNAQSILASLELLAQTNLIVGYYKGDLIEEQISLTK